MPRLDLDALLGLDPSSFVPKLDHDAVRRAADHGHGLADRLQHREVQIRKSFVRREDSSASSVPPALALLRGSPTYLKLELTLLWASAGRGLDRRDVKWTPTLRQVAADRRKRKNQVLDEAQGSKLLLPTDPHTTNFPLVDHAVLLGLARPKSAGVQAISRGLTTLARSKHVWVGRADGATPMVQLRREDGTGAAYNAPGAPVVKIQGQKLVRRKGEGRYLKLPPEFWSNGWIAALSGRAILSLLVLMIQDDLDPTQAGAFLAPSKRDDLFGLSEDTFYRGTQELAYFRLVTKASAPVRAAWATNKHVRNTFILRPEGFKLQASAFDAEVD